MKHTLRTRTFGLGVIGFAVLFAGDLARAAADAGAVGAYVNDDTFVAVRLELSAFTKFQGGESALAAVLPLLDDDAGEARASLEKLARLARSVHEAGVESVYALAGLGDVNAVGGPLLVLQVRQDTSADDVLGKLKPLAAQSGLPESALEASIADKQAILVGRPATLKRYAGLAKSERGELVEPLGRLAQEGAMLAAVFCPGPDFRRVVRELWPELPGPLAPLRGELADKWRHLEMSISAPPSAQPKFALQSSDAESAQRFANLWSDFCNRVAEISRKGSVPDKVRKRIDSLVGALPANVDDNRVTIQLPEDEAKLRDLRALAQEAADEIMESSRRRQRIEQFKRLTLALINYHDVKKQLPASAGFRDRDGKPLLSWRVAILPFLDETDLYKQFHLDEPWDSRHNRALIMKMPSVYADPDPKLQALTQAGKTTYQVPVGVETVFPGTEGIAYRDITDGTSKTIVLVRVEPARAVEWTRPQDWEVNFQKPLDGIAPADRKFIMAAFADGSVQTIPVDIDPAKLRALLTRGGKEVIDRP